MLEEIEADCLRLEARTHSAKAEWEARLAERDSVYRTRELYRQRFRGPALSPTVDERLRQRLNGKTVREMIIDLAQEKDPPVFRVVEINQRLVQAGMFPNSQKASEGVYSTLGRNANSFEKIGKGRYMVKPGAARVPAEPVKAKAGIAPGAHGLRDKVAEIRAAHPTWTREQTAAELERQGWDFGGKKPVFAVGACYANMSQKPKPTGRELLRSVS